MATDFAGAFEALREILRRHSDGMIVQADTPTEFVVITRALGPNGKPMWFGAVTSKKSAVTYHLVPLYFNRKLQSAVAPELLARKQGKTCFNFKVVDEKLFKELDHLTAQSIAGFRKAGYISEQKSTS